jgi:hypothetical protein
MPTWSGRCVNPTNPDVPTIQGLECLFANVLQVIAAIAGLVFLFVLVTAGFKYIFSDNDPKKVASVSSTLTQAAIGLIGVILSWFILQLIQNFTGVNVTQFLIPG